VLTHARYSVKHSCIPRYIPEDKKAPNVGISGLIYEKAFEAYFPERLQCFLGIIKAGTGTGMLRFNLGLPVSDIYI
jgi:hypothetical protein